MTEPKEPTPRIHAAMVEVMRSVTAIAKESGQGVSYKFRSIDAVFNQLHARLADAGLYLAPKVHKNWQVNPILTSNQKTQYQALFHISVKVTAEDGSSTRLGPTLAQAHDVGDKAVYQAQQNAIKYLLLDAFAIPTNDAEMPDMDSRQAEETPAPDAEAIARFEAVPLDMTKENLLVWTKKAAAHHAAGDKDLARTWWEAAMTVAAYKNLEAVKGLPVPKARVVLTQILGFAEKEQAQTDDNPAEKPAQQTVGNGGIPFAPAEDDEEPPPEEPT